MTQDKQIRKAALHLHFREGKDYVEVCEAIEKDYGVTITPTTIRRWALGDIGRRYKEVNCVTVSGDSIRKAMVQEKQAQKDIIGDAVLTGK